MADYKELLRRAVEALPENNGAARRAVYEKARAALVGQLRAINPPLPARDITTHRLQLEDCIRQVEQEASEANIAGLSQDPPNLPPVFAAEARRPASRTEAPPARAAKPEAKPAAPKSTPAPKASPKPSAAPKPEPGAEAEDDSASIEDIIAAAEQEEAPAAKAPEPKRPPKSQPVLVKTDTPKGKDAPERPANKDSRSLPSIVARAEAAKSRPAVSPGFGVSIEGGRRVPAIEPRRDGRAVATARQMEPIEFDVPEDVQAMAAVREVEVEAPADPQGSIDRAIAALESEARGETSSARFADTEVEVDDEPLRAAVPQRKNSLFKGNGRAAVPAGDFGPSKPERGTRTPRPAKEFATPRRQQSARSFDAAATRAQAARGGMGAVGVFLIIFATLLVGAGGAGFWAYQEGYIDLDAMFGRGGTPVVTAAAAPVANPDSTGPGNTETPPAAPEPATQLKADERLVAANEPAAAATTESVEPLALQAPAAGGDAKIEERLGAADAPAATTAEQAVAAVAPVDAAGSQSLLLEASDNGTTGAVPFSGTVEWSRGTDETGQPTLIGKANIPARNLSVELLIRKNSDPSLPASHLMEINFDVAETFIGGSIAGLPGVLLKNEELVQGAPLVGASARVVGNSFLFALSAAPEDSQANTTLLTTRKWMDLALIYASGKRAIITLEKDAEAQQLFTEVFGNWSPATSG